MIPQLISASAAKFCTWASAYFSNFCRKTPTTHGGSPNFNDFHLNSIPGPVYPSLPHDWCCFYLLHLRGFYSRRNRQVSLLEVLFTQKLKPLTVDWELLTRTASFWLSLKSLHDGRIYEVRLHHRGTMCYWQNTHSQLQHCQNFSFSGFGWFRSHFDLSQFWGSSTTKKNRQNLLLMFTSLLMSSFQIFAAGAAKNNVHRSVFGNNASHSFN